MEPENDGLEDDFPDFNWVIFRFQPLNFRGVISEKTNISQRSAALGFLVKIYG